MHINRRRGWEIREDEVTPVEIALNRRAFLKSGGAVAGLSALAAAAGPAAAFGQRQTEADVRASLAATAMDPTADLYPVARNARYRIERELTPELINASYNNFYEFIGGGYGFPGSEKQVVLAAAKLPLRPWTVRIDGLVEKPFDIGIDDLIRKMPLEERIYRHRCVEAWSMTIPWTGFALGELVKLARPLGSAKYLRFETFHNPAVAIGQNNGSYPWPYVEGVTIAEATNELALMVTGAYGKPLAKQFGAPLRLHLPWKYGFKSIKSVTRVSFTDERPVGLWQAVLSREYGFWANVNPQVDHPRWSQAKERVLGTDERVPTQIYNGYAEFVADLYTGIKNEPLFM